LTAGARTGRAGVKAALAQLLADTPDAEWTLSPQFAADVLLLTWTAIGPTARVLDGVDTFVFRDGMIVAQTVSYSVLR
jgi:hypothetical protein